MNISLKLVDTNPTIYKEILSALLPQVKKYMKDVINSIKQELPAILTEAINNSPEYTSLVGGKLRLELGIPEAGPKIEQLLQAWITKPEIKYNVPSISGSIIKSKFSISLIKSSFEDVLNLDAAYVEDTLRGYNLPWLQWLLLEGDMTIVENYEVLIGPSKYSRTGNAIMKEGKGKTWKVPSEYSGTISDNWITRAIESAGPSISSLLEKALKQ